MSAEKFRVLIATTNGPVEILLLTEEDPAICRSVVCIGGTTETAGIAAAYHAFVARPTGVIEKLFGHSCYRLDMSGAIDAGSSWQVGVLLAHALHAEGRLAQENDAADGVIWATGSVRPVDLTVGGISHLAEKMAHSLGRLRQEVLAGRRVLMAIPAQNAAAVSDELAAGFAAHGIELLALSDLRPLCERLELKLPEGARKTPAESLAPDQRDSAGGAGTWRIGGATAVRLLGIAGVAAALLVRVPAADPKQMPQPPHHEADTLVPEMVPFVSSRDQVAIRSIYLPAPGHKALALSSNRIGLATAQPDQATAETAALDACQRATDKLGVQSTCELYAIGNRVVTRRGRPPMPPAPWVIRDPSTERPFVTTDVPLVGEKTRKRIARGYAKNRKPKALALSENGNYSSYRSDFAVDDAIRRALERCGSNHGAACMIVAVDDTFVVPIPRSAKAVGFARPAAINAIAPELREPLARQLGNSTSGWNAVAVGGSGQIGTRLGAGTERAAVDGAMAECGRQDRGCRVVVIGPFLVEPASMPGAAPPPAMVAGGAIGRDEAAGR